MRKKRAVKIRRFWKINPATRIKKSRKIYKRSKTKPKLKKIIIEEDDET